MKDVSNAIDLRERLAALEGEREVELRLYRQLRAVA